MNKNPFILQVITLALFITSCQSNPEKTESDHSTMHDSTGVASQSQSPMMAAMDNMMKEMHHIPMTGNVDLDFALMMKSHHEGAVVMAREELKSGIDEKLQQMAQQIADAQRAEIEALDEFIKTHRNADKNYEVASKDNGFGKVMNKSMAMMMDLPSMEDGAGTDEQFVNLMIPHHQSAVYMAEGLLNYGKDAKLITMAKKMIADQNKEIEEFKTWRDSKGK